MKKERSLLTKNVSEWRVNIKCNDEKTKEMVFHAGHGIRLSDVNFSRGLCFDASGVQCRWAVAEFYRCIVYGMYLCLRDGTGDGRSSVSVYVVW